MKIFWWYFVFVCKYPNFISSNSGLHCFDSDIYIAMQGVFYIDESRQPLNNWAPIQYKGVVLPV